MSRRLWLGCKKAALATPGMASSEGDDIADEESLTAEQAHLEADPSGRYSRVRPLPHANAGFRC